MEEHQKNATKYIEIFERKQKILNMVDQKELNAKKYHALCEKIMKTSDK